MLIYLNRTGFNGLFRLNRRGEYNVPAGRYVNPHICDAEHIRSVARALSLKGVTLECIPFEQVLSEAGAGHFVYCDPPYAPLSRTAAFAHYTAGGFNDRDQTRLQESVLNAARRGAVVLAVELQCSRDRVSLRQPSGEGGRAHPAVRARAPRHQLPLNTARTSGRTDRDERPVCRGAEAQDGQGSLAPRCRFGFGGRGGGWETQGLGPPARVGSESAVIF